MGFIKGDFFYQILDNGTFYCGPLDQSGKVGGTGEDDRNSVHNPERLQRIIELNPKASVLDYGCGNGLLVKYLISNGIDAYGYDTFNKTYAHMPSINFDIITAIEVVEHFAYPYDEIEAMYALLNEGGTVMIETSFTDWMTWDDPYINPEIGHSTIFSHKGLDELMISKGFIVGNHINRNVRLYKKPAK